MPCWKVSCYYFIPLDAFSFPTGSKSVFAWISFLSKAILIQFGEVFSNPSLTFDHWGWKGTTWSPVGAPEDAEPNWNEYFTCCSGQWSAGRVFWVICSSSLRLLCARCSSSTPWLQAAPPASPAEPEPTQDPGKPDFSPNLIKHWAQGVGRLVWHNSNNLFFFKNKRKGDIECKPKVLSFLIGIDVF